MHFRDSPNWTESGLSGVKLVSDKRFSSEDSLNSTEPAVAIASVKYMEVRMKALAKWSQPSFASVSRTV